MDSLQFCYWLQGKLELDGEPKALSAEQVEMVKDHLALVFDKVTPPWLEREEDDVAPDKPSISPEDWAAAMEGVFKQPASEKEDWDKVPDTSDGPHPFIHPSDGPHPFIHPKVPAENFHPFLNPAEWLEACAIADGVNAMVDVVVKPVRSTTARSRKLCRRRKKSGNGKFC